ncbi:MAG: hypothetical protein OXT09_25740, partial [Myxococcales bacterium]|nr:hypothetical protein [Myxococcales bacterium]
LGEHAAPPGAAPAEPAHPNLPPEWTRLVTFLHETQPALGAVLEHGVPARIDPAKVLISFPEGSFFGRQAASSGAREAIATAAERVLGQRPAVEVGFGVPVEATTMAAHQEEQRQQARAETVEAALNHPSVKDAIDVFPEAEGNVDVHLEDR